MLFRVSKEQKEMLNSLRKIETLKVNDEGGISVDPKEIMNKEEFKEAVKKAKSILDL